MNCKLCDKAIVAINNSRKNGKIGKDWDTRKYHKKCWKKLKEEQDLILNLGRCCNWTDEVLFKRLAEFKEQYDLEKLL